MTHCRITPHSVQDELSPAEQAILTGGSGSQQHAPHPSVLTPNPAISAQQQLEFYLWDLCGYLILRESFAPAEQAIAAVEWAYETGLLDPSDGWDPSVRAPSICSILHR